MENANKGPLTCLKSAATVHLRLTLLLAAGAAAGFGAGPETGGRSCSCRTEGQVIRSVRALAGEGAAPVLVPVPADGP